MSEERKLIWTVWGVLIGGVCGFVVAKVYLAWAIAFQAVGLRYIPNAVWTGTPVLQSAAGHPEAFSLGVVMVFAGLGALIVLSTQGRRLCAQCGRENAMTAKYCQYCGRGLAANKNTKWCRACNEEFVAEARYCPHCGGELAEKKDVMAERAHQTAPLTSVCPNCGATNLVQRTECHNCHRPLGNESVNSEF